MPASEAWIRANQANALASTGPKTSEGKDQSRRNALKHGLTGEGVALPDEDAAEVPSRFEAFEKDLKPANDVARFLAHRVAFHAIDPAALAAERSGAATRAIFDPSREATLARRYEAAAERGFYRALRQIEEINADPEASDPSGPIADRETSSGELASSGREALPEPSPEAEPRSEGQHPAEAPAFGSPRERFRPQGVPPTRHEVEPPPSGPVPLG